MIAAWSKELDAFVCAYTGVPLDEKNPKSPWYLNFDHVIPGKKGDLAVCCALANDMKSDMTADEFTAVIRAFAVYRKTGVFPKEAIDLKYWIRMVRPSILGAGRIPAERGTVVTDCGICGKKSVPGSVYCARCRKFLFGKYEHRARLEAMKEAWDPAQDGFICRYTGVRLEENNTKDPWYISFDHRIPGRKGDLAVCARFVNTVKVTLTAEQFPRVMEALANHLDGMPFDRDILKEK
jgi:hypothetical protein